MTPPRGPRPAVAGGVILYGLDDVGDDMTLAKAWLNDAGTVECDNAAFRDAWLQAGIVGRADHGRLFPEDGQAFLDELPYVYKGGYVRAEPVSRLDSIVGAAQPED